MDLNLIDMNSIYDYLTLNKESYAYNFFFYNALFPDDYQYEDLQHEPFQESVPVFLDVFEFGIPEEIQQKKTRQMGLAFSLDEEQKEKYDIKIPGEVEDPILKLDLKTMKPATGIFLGRLKVGESKQEHFNVRIDFYKQGRKPLLEVKICNRYCSAKISHERTIMRIIKLCNMSSTKFIKNQIKSLIRVKRKLSGEFCDLLLNKNIREYNHKKQDYLNLMLCDEILLRRKIKPKDQFQSIIRQENFGRVLASVTEFLIDTEVIDRYNQFSHLYGNKHLDEKTKATISKQNPSGGKYFEEIRYWKINMHVLSK